MTQPTTYRLLTEAHAASTYVTAAQVSATYQPKTLNNAKDYGAVGNGTDDDTAALEAALAAGDTWLPDGAYRVSGLTVPAGRRLTGTWARSYVDTPTLGARIISTTLAQTAPVVTLGSGATLDHVAVIGAGSGASHAGLTLSGTNTVRDVTVSGADTGINYNYTGVNVVDNCQVHDNRVGVANMVDSILSNSFINANTSDGIALSSGSGASTITSCKVEYNGGCGIIAYQARGIVIQNNVVDRNGKAGVSVVSSSEMVVMGNHVHRSNASLSTATGDNANIYQNACSNTIFSANFTGADHQNDDQSGVIVPDYGLATLGGTDVTFTGNDLSGGAVGAIVNYATGTRMIFSGNGGVSSVQTATRSRSIIGDMNTGNLSTGTSAGGTINGLTPLGNYDTGYPYKVRLWSRDGSIGARLAAEATMFVSREGGNASLNWSAINNLLGSAFGIGSGGLSVSATVPADGSSVTFTIANTSGDTHNVTIQVA